MTQANQAAVDCILKQGKRITELEDALKNIYLNTYPMEAKCLEPFVIFFINQSIRGVLTENQIAIIESNFDIGERL